MDWAIRAAKRKIKKHDGDSRSIVEALNEFNDVILQGHKHINILLNEASDWLDIDMNTLEFMQETMGNSGNSEDNMQGHIFEETKATQNFGFVNKHDIPNQVDNSMSTSLSDIKQSHHVKKETENTVSSINEASKKCIGKSSPWSPYKVEKTLKAAAYSQKYNLAKDKHQRAEFDTECSLQTKQEKGNTETDIFSEKILRQNQQTRDRVQRRSNMFIPLPNKHPLVVQPLISGAKLCPEKKIGSISDKLDVCDVLFKPSDISRVYNIPSTSPIKEKRFTSITNSNVFDRLSSNVTKSFGNKVRCSKSPLKEQNDQGKHHRCNSSQTYKADLDGSPVRKKSQLTHNTTDSNIHIHETLKGIFDPECQNHTHNLVQDKQINTRNSIVDDMNPSLKNANGLLFHRKSLIPKLDNKAIVSIVSKKGNLRKERRDYPLSPTKNEGKKKVQKKNSVGLKNTNKLSPKILNSLGLNNSINSKFVQNQEISPMEKKLYVSRIPQKVNSFNMILKTPRREICSKNKLEFDSPIPDSTIPPQVTTKHLNMEPSSKFVTNERCQQILENEVNLIANSNTPLKLSNEFKKDNHSPDNQNTFNIDSNHITTNNKPKLISHDRLTKFQLTSSHAGSEKQDLKEKLNKRLSEVIRNQQEQQLKRRQQNYKRKSQLEDETKRRTKIVYDSTDFAKAKSHLYNTQSPKVAISNVLSDLNVVDHREIIGGDTVKESLTNEDMTLPEIYSDSDNDKDDNLILAQWARSPYLEEELLHQQNWDTKKIFGPIRPLHVDEIFQNSRLSKLKAHQSMSNRLSLSNGNSFR